MKTSFVCDRCHKDPTPFECGNDDGSPEEVGFYHIIPRKCDDPGTQLMSNGDLVFKIAVTKEHPILEDEAHICANCFDEMFGDPTFENEDDVDEQ